MNGLVVAAALLAACGPKPAPGDARSATLVYTQSVGGDIEPCG
jgi:hypothetical protein